MNPTEYRANWYYGGIFVWSDGRLSDKNFIFLEPNTYNEDGSPRYRVFVEGQPAFEDLWYIVYRTYVRNGEHLRPDKVYFIDGDPTNCTMENMRFFIENSGHYIEITLVQTVNNTGGIDYIRDWRYGNKVKVKETGDIYDSATEVARALGIPKSNISSVLRGVRKTAGGYSFEYLDPFM